MKFYITYIAMQIHLNFNKEIRNCFEYKLTACNVTAVGVKLLLELGCLCFCSCQNVTNNSVRKIAEGCPNLT